MSSVEEPRRPVRILQPAEIGQAAPDRSRQPAAGLAPAADRFRRTLVAPRRAEAAPDQEARSGMPASERGPAVAEAARPPVRLVMPALLEEAVGEAEDAGEDEAVAALAGGQPGAGQPAPADGQRRPVGGDSGAAASVDAGPDGWADDMARKVVTLCKRADPAFVTWTVTVPMDPDTLPQTELRLHMAPHWLSLRFASQSSQSVRLIAAHRERLVQLLEGTPGLPHGIDVEIS